MAVALGDQVHALDDALVVGTEGDLLKGVIAADQPGVVDPQGRAASSAGGTGGTGDSIVFSVAMPPFGSRCRKVTSSDVRSFFMTYQSSPVSGWKVVLSVNGGASNASGSGGPSS